MSLSAREIFALIVKFTGQNGIYSLFKTFYLIVNAAAFKGIYYFQLPIIMCECVLSRFSHVQFFAPTWAVAGQAPLSMVILKARIL